MAHYESIPFGHYLLGVETRVPHPSGLRVRVFLRCVILFGDITAVATCILLPSVVIGAIHFWGHGGHATDSCESWTKYEPVTVSG